ncbi:MAG: myxococcus cysteine-rich repeat containing protein, partial [Polyangiaceae bacterium]
MRNSHPPIAQLASGLLFALLVTACGTQSAPGSGRPITGDGAGGSSDMTSGGGSNNPSGGTDLVVNDMPPDQVAPPGCGDGTLTSDEACDDGNTVSGDGCSAVCLQVERGFSCPNPGKAC